ncbi:MAG: PhnD/SsuA/transferrin family substrate-binding protein [Litoreibacter sp.]|uniref:phosphate/phosphite/phosphonate ABC transporter substrate-binding protein n=1 Tax=Litoreibacter sp. TaxID=1969459 RepID=UPI00329A6D86
MVASLMMYHRPELIKAHQSYWELVRQHLAHLGIEAPKTLSQDRDEFWVWKHPQLLLSQTCGMPYRLWLHDQVSLVGTPDYDLKDCPAGYYRSALVVRRDDDRTGLTSFQNETFAYNQTFSQSGYAAPYTKMTDEQGSWFTKRLETGQHLDSARAVSDGRADIASIDAVTWRLIQRYEAFAEKLRVLDWTTPTPALPLITALHNDAGKIFEAVKGAIFDLEEADRQDLGLKGILEIPKAKYLEIPNPPQELEK